MRKIAVVAGLVVLGVITWRVISSLSSDALGMAVGLVFGVVAGLPAAALVLATSSKRRALEEEFDERGGRYAGNRQLPAYPYQPPVIVVAGAQPGPQQMAPLPQGTAPYYVPPQAAGWGQPERGGGARRFKIVGEHEEWLE